ncbi:MAG: hypothetical protein EAS49_11405 [Brucella intermedia]|nr:MAG: hypothetical protein EAS49_11405 [Brucella intermedia]
MTEKYSSLHRNLVSLIGWLMRWPRFTRPDLFRQVKQAGNVSWLINCCAEINPDFTEATKA